MWPDGEAPGVEVMDGNDYVDRVFCEARVPKAEARRRDDYVDEARVPKAVATPKKPTQQER
eukprot:2215626-Lingulodinium_polyedra.AAC.1